MPIGKQKPPRNKGPSGFTLIELVLVCVIILILVSLSTPLFRKPFAGVRVRNTCRQLTHLMRYVQAKAIAERRLCRINFNFEQGSFWPVVEKDESPGEFERIEGKWGRTFDLPQGVSISGKILSEAGKAGETLVIRFYPDGSSDKAEIKIFGSAEDVFTITTQRNIGYVNVQEE